MSFVWCLNVMHMSQFESMFGIFLMRLESGRASGIQCALTDNAWQFSRSNDQAVFLLLSSIASLRGTS
jgi:hypothetical protein